MEEISLRRFQIVHSLYFAEFPQLSRTDTKCHSITIFPLEQEAHTISRSPADARGLSPLRAAARPPLPPGQTRHKLGCDGPAIGTRRTAKLHAPARAACGTACSAATHPGTPLCATHAGPPPVGGQRPFPRVSRRDNPAHGPYAHQRALSPARSRRCSPAHLNPLRRRADLERCFRICFLMIPAMAPAGTHRSPRPARNGDAPHPSASPSPSRGDSGERRSRCQHSRSLGSHRHLGCTIA